MQLSAYKEGVDQYHGIKVDVCANVYLGDDGEFELVRYTDEEINFGRLGFMSAMYLINNFK